MTSYCSNMGAVWSRTIYLPNPTIGSFSASFPSVLPSSPSGSSAFRFTSQAMTEWKAFVAGFFQSTPTQNPNNHLRFKGDDTFLQALGRWSENCPQRVNNKYYILVEKDALTKSSSQVIVGALLHCQGISFAHCIDHARGIVSRIGAGNRDKLMTLDHPTYARSHYCTILLMTILLTKEHWNTLHFRFEWQWEGTQITKKTGTCRVIFIVKPCWTMLNIINWIVESQFASRNQSILNRKFPKSHRKHDYSHKQRAKTVRLGPK